MNTPQSEYTLLPRQSVTCPGPHLLWHSPGQFQAQTPPWCPGYLGNAQGRISVSSCFLSVGHQSVEGDYLGVYQYKVKQDSLYFMKGLQGKGKSGFLAGGLLQKWGGGRSHIKIFKFVTFRKKNGYKVKIFTAIRNQKENWVWWNDEVLSLTRASLLIPVESVFS